MKTWCAVLLVLTILSCGGVDRGTPPGPDSTRVDATEAAMEEYAAVEQLAENAIDPKRASIDMLIAVPDFPIDLAERVIEARQSNPSGGRWFSLLTPPEREKLRRFERFIELPRKRPTRIRGRMLCDLPSAGAEGKADAYIAAENERWVLRARSRSVSGRNAVSAYCSRMLFGSSAKLCCGDFRADFASGLLFDGSFSFYPFSAGFPLRGYRWIVPSPAFSAEALRGAAVELWRGGRRGMLFAGRRRVYRGGSFVIDSPLTWAARGVVSFTSGEAGVTCSGVDDSSEQLRLAVDGRWRRGRVRGGFEIGSAGDGAAGSWCISILGTRGEASLLMYRVPFGFGGSFGSVPAGGIAPEARQRGLVAAARYAMGDHTIVRTSYERFTRGSATETSEREIVRSECVTRWRRASLTVSCLWNRRLRGRCIPCPGGTRIPPSESDRLSLLFIRTWGCAGRLRLSAQIASDEDGKGGLVASSVRFGLFRCRIRCTSAVSMRHPFRGRPVFYLYEPAFDGSFPWFSARGGGLRCTLLTESTWRGFTIGVRLCGSSSRDGEAGIALSYDR